MNFICIRCDIKICAYMYVMIIYMKLHYIYIYNNVCIHMYTWLNIWYILHLFGLSIWLLELGWGGQEVRNLRSQRSLSRPRGTERVHWAHGRFHTPSKAIEAWLTGSFKHQTNWDLVDNWRVVEVYFKSILPNVLEMIIIQEVGIIINQPLYGFVQEVFWHCSCDLSISNFLFLNSRFEGEIQFWENE